MAEANPHVTVVLLVGNRRERSARALASVLAQDQLETSEVVLVDLASPGTPPLPGSDHPRVRLVRKERRGASYGQLRAEAVGCARGRHVAFLEDHCEALPGWLAAIGRALDGPWVGVGGEVHTANPGVGISDAVALMNYQASFRPPARHGRSPTLPGHNSAYRRDVLLSYGDGLPDLLQSEVLLQWKLTSEGHALGIDPAVKFRHINETTLGQICRGYFRMQRHLGDTRARAYAWTPLQRLLRALLTPAVPFVRLARYAGAARRERPSDLPLVARHAPAILVAQASGALGSALGYLFGAGESGRRFADYELDNPR